MEFLKNNNRLSFLYNGKSIWELSPQKSVRENGDEVVTEYILNNELKITNIAKKYADFDGYEWVTWFENISAKPTGIISELYDCDVGLPFEHDDPLGWTAFLPDPDKDMRIYSPSGSDCVEDEFYSDVDRAEVDIYVNHIYPNNVKEYKNRGGRSSDKKAPFFNIARQNKGVIFAIGWTGQWNCRIERSAESLNIKTKIEDTHFRLFPGEKIRTSSFVMMNYEGDFADSQNKWRRFVKKHFSLIGSEGRGEYAPFCAGVWGGMTTSSVLERIEKVKSNNIPVEYIWMDAGWYGISEKESPDEFEGDWAEFTGDWRVNKLHHPDGLLDVTKAVRDAGLKFLLWFEPERVIYTTPTASKHPEYFLRTPYEGDINCLLNLGNEDAWQYCFDTLAELIERLGISCYRQDFNFEPLEFWRANDDKDRQGISEIKHIMGMYRLWDALLEKFPHLIIDNCASGGRRIDIETLRRSVPLWRSDVQCPANYPVRASQIHNITFGTWMPYSGTGSGREWGDVYRIRSAYAGGMTVNYLWSCDFGNDHEQIEWIKKYGEEYLRARPYFSCDMYPLTDTLAGENAWCVVQYNRPEENDGILQVFRREKSINTKAEIQLRALDSEKTYVFTDADDDSFFEISGKELMKKGLELEIKEKRTAKLFFYKEK